MDSHTPYITPAGIPGVRHGIESCMPHRERPTGWVGCKSCSAKLGKPVKVRIGSELHKKDIELQKAAQEQEQEAGKQNAAAQTDGRGAP